MRTVPPHELTNSRTHQFTNSPIHQFCGLDSHSDFRFGSSHFRPHTGHTSDTWSTARASINTCAPQRGQGTRGSTMLTPRVPNASSAPAVSTTPPPARSAAPDAFVQPVARGRFRAERCRPAVSDPSARATQFMDGLIGATAAGTPCQPPALAPVRASSELRSTCRERHRRVRTDRQASPGCRNARRGAA